MSDDERSSDEQLQELRDRILRAENGTWIQLTKNRCYSINEWKPHPHGVVTRSGTDLILNGLKKIATLKTTIDTFEFTKGGTLITMSEGTFFRGEEHEQFYSTNHYVQRWSVVYSEGIIIRTGSNCFVLLQSDGARILYDRGDYVAWYSCSSGLVLRKRLYAAEDAIVHVGLDGTQKILARVPAKAAITFRYRSGEGLYQFIRRDEYKLRPIVIFNDQIIIDGVPESNCWRLNPDGVIVSMEDGLHLFVHRTVHPLDRVLV